MKILVDTILYNPAVAVYELNKEDGTAIIYDIFNQKMKQVKLHCSKNDCYDYYFYLNRRSYHTVWLFTEELQLEGVA